MLRHLVFWIRLIGMSSLVIGTLSACQGTSANESATASASVATVTVTAPVQTEESNEIAIPVDPVQPLLSAQAKRPVLMQIPELDFEVAIQPMEWEIVTDASGQRSTRWVIPLAAAGWHTNSAGAGAAGNTILSGQQATGEAVFAPLALGEIVVGQHLLITDEDGAVFVYQISEISRPIPIVGATTDDLAAAKAYIQPSETAQATLITGWPDFSTTHRIFAVAKFIGQAAAR
jgi:hypothetical protein